MELEVDSSLAARPARRGLRVGGVVGLAVALLAVVAVGAFFGGAAFGRAHNSNPIAASGAQEFLHHGVSGGLSSISVAPTAFTYHQVLVGETLSYYAVLNTTASTPATRSEDDTTRTTTIASTSSTIHGLVARFSRTGQPGDHSLELQVDFPTDMPFVEPTPSTAVNTKHFVRITMRDRLLGQSFTAAPVEHFMENVRMPSDVFFLLEGIDKLQAIASRVTTLFDEGISAASIELGMRVMSGFHAVALDVQNGKYPLQPATRQAGEAPIVRVSPSADGTTAPHIHSPESFFDRRELPRSIESCQPVYCPSVTSTEFSTCEGTEGSFTAVGVYSYSATGMASCLNGQVNDAAAAESQQLDYTFFNYTSVQACVCCFLDCVVTVDVIET